MIPYGKQHISQEDIEAVVGALQSDFLTQGPKIREFEEAFAHYIGSTYAVAVANGTAALHLCALALNVQEGDRVITTPITFAASANCIKYCGGEIVFADIVPGTYTLDIHAVRKLLENAPKGYYRGIIPVDFSGYPVNLEAFRELADQHNLWIIEDACHAPGGYFMDSREERQQCGNGKFAELAIFSFHPVKHIAAGEGGMITTNDPELYQRLLTLRTHGITRDASTFQNDKNLAFASHQYSSDQYPGWYMEMQELGYNYRLTDFQAALGLSQLKRAEEGVKRRIEIARRYDEAFAALGIVKQKRDDNHQNAFHLYVVEIEDRYKLYEYLRDRNIYTQVHYIPLHLMPYYQQFGWKQGDFPVAESYYQRCLSLPMYPTLKKEEQDYVIQCIKEFLGE
ncbi:UDP-4-amino-4,6-dideoxy-N-acetyl-beta-L-altrosamine transaminase [Catalinimonas niigatensis]|uniref:UDP-4-amino-4, 6-dideoxy-N-acetyl-beta-L-altrosamine transaminase n=1 Tax=Catalinimonas niigatensis TaxID=1397264 RepID=UPI00266710C3|nr:UDP-4-amino-4,6-dideoxy-N-acetyl-beta-L-altrosamine transaminase [Catalinimonas niigatensis]WPP53307.1 UDP-4-amino-4,6-dideoxy-N-acetyl-beta-L-altrosamine transaminase [Catalinimonas niigatensis]